MPGPLTFRSATTEDCPLLAGLNRQLIRDEGHRNTMTEPELAERMRAWLTTGGYRAVLFERDGAVVAYALYRDDPGQVYLRQLFVVREQRRRGLGREAVAILRDRIWPKGKRLTVDVLTANAAALAFWRSVGYRDYCLTLEILP